MPSESAPQQRLMRAAAHTPGGYGGVPQSVGRDFVTADKRTGTRFEHGGKVNADGVEWCDWCSGKTISKRDV